MDYILINDPESYKATTLDQAIRKHNALMRQGNADLNWAKNIIDATKDLVTDSDQENFIRYLANPCGYKNQDSKLFVTLENTIQEQMPKDGTFEGQTRTQKYHLTTENKYATEATIVVTNIDESSDNEVEFHNDDEKADE